MSTQLQFTIDELKVIHMSLLTMIEDTTETSKNQKIPFTPEARRAIKEMVDAAKSAKLKFEKCWPQLRGELPPFKDGDEKEFLTKLL